MISSERQPSPGQREHEMLQFRGAGNKKPYTFASQPQALSMRDQMYRDNMCKQMGYTNIMHDKRVVRGSNFSKKPYRPKWNPYFGYAKQLSSEPGKESSTALEAEIRRRSMARKKAMDHQTRALRLRLGAPKLTRGRQNVDIQTDTTLEEFYEYPPSQTCGAQTEFETEEQFSNPGTGKSVGTDASTQVDDKEFFDFDIEVTPIAEAVVTDVFRQAMREVLYEDELDARARQQRALYLRRTIDDIEKQRLEQEDERLNKVITDHAQFMDDGGKTRLPEPNLSNGDNASTVKNPEFMSWLDDEIKAHKSKDMDNDDILKSIIEDLIKRRM